jgi:hypothetical protein
MLVAVTLAPASSSAPTTSRCPKCAARIRGVLPLCRHPAAATAAAAVMNVTNCVDQMGATNMELTSQQLHGTCNPT